VIVIRFGGALLRNALHAFETKTGRGLRLRRPGTRR
jgi:hypothetical protein